MRKRFFAAIIAVLVVLVNLLSALPAAAEKQIDSVPKKDVEYQASFYRDEPTEPTLVEGFYFESQTEADEWTLVDSDGDGLNWGWFGYGINYLNFSTGNQAYEGIGMISSASMSGGSPIEPDNWIVSPAVTIPAGEASLTFYARARIPASVGEHFAVYAGTSPEIAAMAEIIPETEAEAEYVRFSADLTEYAGGEVYIAFRNFNSTGINGVAVDQAEVWSLGGNVPSATPEPTDSPEPALVEGFYFESQTEADEWTLVDMDGDGLNWGWFGYGINYLNFSTGNQAYEGIGMISSASKEGSSVLTPDNWVISPAVILPAGEASLTFYVRARIPSSIGEHFAVYAGTSFEIESMTEIVPETETTAEYIQLSADLTEYAGGEVYIAFRNFNSTGINGVAVDQAEVWSLGGNVPSETPEPTDGPEPTEEPEPLSEIDIALNAEGGTIHFENDAAYPWYTVEDEGRLYAMAGNSGHVQEYGLTTSTISATVTVEEDSVLVFDYMACGLGEEPTWDHCSFALDSHYVFDVGDLGAEWREFKCELSAGTHVMRWQFSKFMYTPYSAEPMDMFAVDNVYVGPAIAAAEIIATEFMDIEVNRSGQIEWTILPQLTFDKDVVFTVADPSIASVDESGYVMGLSEGDTFITTSLVSDPSVFAVTEIHVTDTGLTFARLYGRVAFDLNGNEYDGKLISFTDFDPNKTNVEAEIDYDLSACAYAFGKIYGFTRAGVFFSAEMSDPSSAAMGAVYDGGQINSLAFDYTRYMLYGISRSTLWTSEILSIDPGSGIVKRIGVIYDVVIGLAIDETGSGYFINNSGELFSVDLDSAEYALIGPTNIESNFLQDLCYDFDGGCIYWAQFFDRNSNGLYRVNKETAEAEYLGKIGTVGIEVVGLFTIPTDEPAPQTSVTGVSVLPSELTLEIGETAELTAIVHPFTAENKNVIWSVDNEQILSADQNGLVRGIDCGEAVVTATTEDGGFTASALITVGSMIAGFYFEDEEEVRSWQFVDMDGDGNNWIWNRDVPTDILPFEGLGIVFSESWSNQTGDALTPDNWAVTSPIELPVCNILMTLHANGCDPSYPAEHFAVYAGISPDPNEMERVSSEFVTTNDYTQYEINLSKFAGETVYVAIRHYMPTSHQFIICVDNVEIWRIGEALPELPIFGDANGDGIVDTVDALALMRWVMGIEELDEANIDPWCDVNGDGVIDFTDALLIVRKGMGIIELFPIEISG